MIRTASLAALIMLVTIFCVQTAQAEFGQDLEWYQSANIQSDARIDARTRLIESEQLTTDVLAAALFLRGYSYENNKQFDRAITDYDEANRIVRL